MSLIGETWRRFMFLLRRGELDRELAEEMRQHAEWKARKNIESGVSPEEARLLAQRQLGNTTRLHEDSRQSWGFPLLESVAQDIRYALRGLRKAPGFTIVALMTLALGIGASTAIFSIVNTVLLRPLTYKDSSRLVHIWTVSAMFPEFQMGQSIPNLTDIRARAHSLESVATYELQRMNLTGRGEPEQLSVAAVSSSFLGLFGIHPALGRDFLPDDEQMKNGDLVLLSHGLWQRRFGGEAGVVGMRIMLGQKPYTVAGVLPQGFTYPEKTEAWIPLVISPKEKLERSRWFYFTLAKLREGVSLKSAQSEMEGIAAAIAGQYPKDASGIRFPVVTLQEAMVGRGKLELLALLGAVGFLLLIACANVGNLVLSRGLQRQREIAVRAALGARRRRILRQLLTESLLLAFAGGLAGLALAAAGIRVFRALAPAEFPRLDELRVEPATALFACVISALAGVLCGLAPALTTARADLNLAIQEKTTAAHQDRRFSLRSFLVVTEVALALVLLTGSALMVQSMVRLLRVDPGWRIDHMLTAELNLDKARYASDEAQRIFVRRLLDSLDAQPQFTGVALSNNSLLAGSTALISFDPATMGLNDKKTNLEARSVSPGFFEALGIRLLRGRLFSDRDVKGAPQVVIINESLARRYFPGQDPLGKVFKFGPDPTDQYQIVGEVSDTRDIHLNAPPRPQVYFPLLQDAYNGVNITVRSDLEPTAAMTQLQRSVWSVDQDLPLTHVHSMAEVISTSVAQPRFRTWLLTVFAFAGLSLTLIGIYGVISYSVGRRTHEMGIRIALGAQPRDVLRLVLRDGVVMALVGAACGLVGSFLLMRFLSSQLYDIKPGDPLTLAGTALLMVLVAMGASYIPARRATKVDPLVALRHE